MENNDVEQQQTVKEEKAQQYHQLKGGYAYALLVKLRARSSGSLVAHAGQHAHAALFKWFAEVDSAFAEILHEPNLRRPFTCSSLVIPTQGAARTSSSSFDMIQAGETYWIRFTLLSERLFHMFISQYMQIVVPTLQGVQLPALRLGGISFDVVDVVTGPTGANDLQQESILRWSGVITYEKLVEQACFHQLPVKAQHIEMEFCSPTTFSRGHSAGKRQFLLFPEPGRVFDTLAHSWNCWAPDVYCIDTYALQRYVEEWVIIASYELFTHPVHLAKSTLNGFVGTCSYLLLETKASNAQVHSIAQNRELTPLQAIYLLGSYAFFSGVGYKTTMGMGRTRLVL